MEVLGERRGVWALPYWDGTRQPTVVAMGAVFHGSPARRSAARLRVGIPLLIDIDSVIGPGGFTKRTGTRSRATIPPQGTVAAGGRLNRHRVFGASLPLAVLFCNQRR